MYGRLSDRNAVFANHHRLVRLERCAFVAIGRHDVVFTRSGQRKTIAGHGMDFHQRGKLLERGGETVVLRSVLHFGRVNRLNDANRLGVPPRRVISSRQMPKSRRKRAALANLVGCSRGIVYHRKRARIAGTVCRSLTRLEEISNCIFADTKRTRIAGTFYRSLTVTAPYVVDSNGAVTVRER